MGGDGRGIDLRMTLHLAGLALPRPRGAAILGLSSSSQESPAIPKRKPPSQRPERQLDETAQAIARDREEARAEKSPEAGRPASAVSRPQTGPVGKITARRKSVGPAVTPSSKRPKTGGGG